MTRAALVNPEPWASYTRTPKMLEDYISEPDMPDLTVAELMAMYLAIPEYLRLVVGQPSIIELWTAHASRPLPLASNQ